MVETAVPQKLRSFSKLTQRRESVERRERPTASDAILSTRSGDRRKPSSPRVDEMTQQPDARRTVSNALGWVHPHTELREQLVDVAVRDYRLSLRLWRARCGRRGATKVIDIGQDAEALLS